MRVLLVVLAALAASPLFGQTVPDRDAASDQVGATVGEFRVDESGQATYSIPIYVPPGTAGVQPKLSLNYSSGGGPGALGKGWSLGGVSSITRCRATRESGDFVAGGVPVDGDPKAISFRQQDRFCLDGQRLILVSTNLIYGDDGAEYRLELDRYTRIFSRGGLNPVEPSFGNPYTGPNSFEVQRKDGSTSTYGNTADSYINGNGTGFQSAAAWAMSRMKDSTGNYIDYEYEENPAPDSSEFVIKRVKHTGKISPVQAPYATITFDYETVALREGYSGGSRSTRTRRLTTIDVAGMRWYRLTYEPLGSLSGTGEDTLKSLKECRDSSQTICYPETTFTWTAAAQNYGSAGFRGDTGLEDLIDHRLGDVDGDGRLDLVYVRDTGDSCQSNVINVRFAVRNVSGVLEFPRVQNQPSICTGHAANVVNRYWQLLDYDGDGRDDLMIAEAQEVNGNPPRWRIRPAVGRMGFDTSRDLLGETNVTIAVSEAGGIQVADFNGDGLPDMVFSNTLSQTGIRYLERVGASAVFRFSEPYFFDARSLLPDNHPCRPGSIPSCNVFIYTTGDLRPQDYDGDGRADIVGMAIRNLTELPADGFISSDDVLRGPFPVDHFVFLLRTRDRLETAPQRTQDMEFWWTSYDVGPLSPPTMPKWISAIADFNGDGLPDFLGTQGDPADGYQACKNRGAKDASFFCSGPFLTDLHAVKTADINADGRNDLVHFNTASTTGWHNYYVRYAGLDGSFGTTSSVIPGTGTQGWNGSSRDIFADLDSDAAPDYLSLLPIPNFDNERTGTGDGSVRFKPKDVITEITNGYGAKTTISYVPLTNRTIYAKDIGSRNDADPITAGTQIYGRGSPVLDFMAPMYLVSHVQSDVPVWGNPAARSLLSYRYVGAKMQAGGRGFLGFREIVTTDHNYSGTPLGHVVSRTAYAQGFPFIGMPERTEKWVIAGAPAALGACRAFGLDNDGCAWTFGTGAPTIAGSLVQKAETLYDTIPNLVSGVQEPLFTYAFVTQERRYALPMDAQFGVSRGAFLSYVATGECGHDAYGNPGIVGIDTHSSDPFPGAAAPSLERIPAGMIPCGPSDPGYEASIETRKRTINSTWGNTESTWQLGRLYVSEVQHSRREPGGALTTSSRIASFGYYGSGTKSGLLNKEAVEVGAGERNELQTYYDLDDYGNRIAAYTCSAGISEATCRSPLSGMQFRPGKDDPEPATLTRRYSRTTFDAIGRYTTASYEPYFDPNASLEWTEHASSTACTLAGYGSRDEFGELQCAADANAVTAKSRRGSFGREYWAWRESDAVTLAGVESTTTYAWCAGVHSGAASCPDGAVFRSQTVTTGSATSWAFFDVLGRQIAGVEQSFNSDTNDPNLVFLSITCTGFDAEGRSIKGTVPQFLTGTHAAAPNFAGQSAICTSTSTALQSTTSFDVLGRVTKVVAPDAGETLKQYAGLTTTVTAPCNNDGTIAPVICNRTWTEVTNASGETIRVTDANGLINGLTVEYQRDTYGNVREVKRNAGNGDILNTATFDSRGRKTQASDTDGGAWTFEYNAAGELIKRIDAFGRATRFDMDARGRLWRTRVMALSSGACPDCLFRNGFEGSDQQGTLDDVVQYDTATHGLGLVHWDSRTDAGAPTISRTLSYDVLARPVTKDTLIDAKTFTDRTVYDPLGRVLKAQTEFTESYPNPNGAYAYAEGAEYTYNARGYLERVCRAVDATTTPSSCPSNMPGAPVYWRVLSQDARGQVLQDERHDNVALKSTRTYNLSTGRIATLKSGAGDGLQDLTYGFDQAGNLMRREDHRPGVSNVETFRYDILDRVIESKLNGNGLMALSYDKLGNICAKNGNTYIYAGRAGCAGALANPSKSAHAVTQALGNTYHYDVNGQQLSSDASGTASDRYTEFDVHQRMTGVLVGSFLAPSFQADFTYAPDLSLARQIERDAGNQIVRRTLYTGALEWTDRSPGGAANREARLSLPGGLILVTKFIEGAIPAKSHRYAFSDHLGSVDVIADETGAAVERMSFDVHGSRRDVANWFTPVTYGIDATTRRGYTGHEQIDRAGLIHMGARMYDPQLGRFIQPDPMVESDATQGWNRYSYVLNNPLSATDPTGMLTQRQAVRAGRVVAAIVITIFLPQAGFWAGTAFEGFGAIVASGFVAGGVSGGWQGAIWGAFSAITFSAIGTRFPGAEGLQGAEARTAYWHKVLAHGTAGGVLNHLQGGKFGHGFISNGATAVGSPSIGQLDQFYQRVFATAILGGTVSDITGGNFGNGALTSAFAFAAAELASSGGITGSKSGGSGARGASPMSNGLVGEMSGDGYGPPAPFATVEDAAKAGLREAAPIGSVYEYAGAVFSSGSGYYATYPVTINDTNDFAFRLETGVNPVAIYHTHPLGGYDDAVFSTLFSPSDLRRSEGLGITSYIGVYHDRSIRFYDPQTMKPQTLKDFEGTGRTFRNVSTGKQLCPQCF
jgi:RHS repeat-associated protein